MFSRNIKIIGLAVVALSLLLMSDGNVSARGGFGGGGGGGGGFRSGGGGGGGFGGGGGSVSYSRSSGGGSWNGGGAANRDFNSGGTTYRPGNSGSLQYGSGATGVRTANSGEWVTPSGGKWAAGEGPNGGKAVVHENPSGGGSAWVKGPAGGEGTAIRGADGGKAAGVKGADGGAAGAYRSPYGSSGAAVRGPAGNAAGVFHGPAGGTVAGVRGPYGAGVVAALPRGYTAVAWHGNNYYHYGYNFYRPYWYGGSVCYWPVDPPVGWFFPTLPDSYVLYTVGDTPYYWANGVYYQPATQDGQQGYTVVDNPNPNQTPAAADPNQPQFADTAPDPFKVFKNMSDFLGRQNQFTMQLSDTSDEISDTGSKIQMSSTRTVWVQRPDRVAVDFVGDNASRRVVYDGKTVTAVDLTKNAYTTIPIQGTLDEMLDKLAKDYGMAQPVDNFLYKDIYSRVFPKLQAGQYVGIDLIGGVKCDHVAFRQEGIDWEMWVQQGESPMPRKISVTHTDLASHPQYTLEVTKWNSDPIPASAFDIQLPKDVKKIDVLTMTAQVKKEQ